jgi:hypothetical protein
MNSDAAQLSQIPDFFGNILTALIPLIGLTAFIMILAGGFKILTSGGDPKGLQGGRQTITLAIAGLALSIISWLILVLIENITGAPVTKFNFSFK